MTLAGIELYRHTFQMLESSISVWRKSGGP
jgi:hypothetical protein